MNDHFSTPGSAGIPRNVKHLHNAVFGLTADEDLPLPVKFLLEYDTQDPFAVTFSFGSQSDKWTFARELLTTGLERRSSEGGVRLGPLPAANNVTIVELDSPEGRTLFESPTWQLQDFLSCSYAIVPRGQEHLCLKINDALPGFLSEKDS
jgi:hypothetical protein